MLKQQFLRLGLLLACAVPLLSGCEWIDHNVRPRTSGDEPRLSDAMPEVAIDPEDSKGFDRPSRSSEPADPPFDPSGPVSKRFFKSSRLSGAMSSEGRDIERSLGID